MSIDEPEANVSLALWWYVARTTFWPFISDGTSESLFKQWWYSRQPSYTTYDRHYKHLVVSCNFSFFTFGYLLLFTDCADFSSSWLANLRIQAPTCIFLLTQSCHHYNLLDIQSERDLFGQRETPKGKVLLATCSSVVAS